MFEDDFVYYQGESDYLHFCHCEWSRLLRAIFHVRLFLYDFRSLVLIADSEEFDCFLSR